MAKSEVEKFLESTRNQAEKVFSECVETCRGSKNLLDIEKTISGAISHIARLEQCLWNSASGIVIRQPVYNAVDELDGIRSELSEKLTRVNEEIRIACSLDPAVQALIRGIFEEKNELI